MKKPIVKTSIILLAILLTVSCTEVGSQYVESNLESQYTGDVRTIGVYLPDGYNKKNTYPTIYMADGISFNSGDYRHVLDSLIGHGIIEPIIVSCSYNSKGVSASSSETFNIDFFTEELMPFVESKYSVSSDRNDKVYYGISGSADAGLKISLTRQELMSEYWCFSPLNSDISFYSSLSESTAYKIYWVNKDELKSSFDYFPSMVNSLRKRGGSVKTKTLDTPSSTRVWREEFIKLVSTRFGVEQQ